MRRKTDALYRRYNLCKGLYIAEVSNTIDFAQANFMNSWYKDVKDLDLARNVKNRWKN